MAYAAWSVIASEQPTTSKWNILGTNDAEFNALIQRDGTGVKILDDAGNEIIKGVKVASAVNEVTTTNAATGNAPSVAATGGDTNIDINLVPKGSGRVVLNAAGAGASATVATSQTTTSTSYTDLATTGPAVTVTIGNSGQALATVGCASGHGSADLPTFMSFAISGNSTVSAGTWGVLTHRLSTATAQAESSWTVLVTGLTAGSNTFTAKYKVSAGTGTFVERYISVVPQ